MAATEKTASERVYDALRTALLRRDHEPGETLLRPALAARYGVSLTPVREALFRLEREGFVTVSPRSRTAVAPIGVVAIHQAQFLRRALEVEVVGRLADDEARRDCEVLRGLAGPVEPADVMAADLAFHGALFERVGMGGLWENIRPLLVPLERCRALAPMDGARAARGHHDILDRIAAGDRRGAVRAMEAHLAGDLGGLSEWRRAHPEMFAED